MISEILGVVFSWVLTVIGALGYAGIAGLMFLSAANIPIPSEAIMPFAGFVASGGKMTLMGVIIVGVTGGFLGSLASYFIGRKLGKKSLDIFSKVSLHGKEDFIKTEKWFSRFGPWVVLAGLSLPVVRSFISLPAGVFGIRPKHFIPLALVSITIWSSALAVLGFVLGDNWMIIGSYFRKFDILIVGIGVVFVAVWIIKHLKPRGK